MRKLIEIGIVLSALLGIANVSSAQIVSPRAVEFESPDHTSPLSKPVDYIFEWYAIGASAPTQSKVIGASAVTPKPGTNPQKYEVTFAQLGAYPAGQVFTIRMKASNSSGLTVAVAAPETFGLAAIPASPKSVAVVP